MNIGPIYKCNTKRGFTSATQIKLRLPLATGIDLGFVDRTGIFEKEKQCMFPYFKIYEFQIAGIFLQITPLGA